MEKVKKDHRQELTDKIIAHLEAGTAPWVRPWTPSEKHYNPTTDNAYRGINQLALQMESRNDPRWCTFVQAKEQGWHINKGEKGTSIMFVVRDREIAKLDESGKIVKDENGKPVKECVPLEKPYMVAHTVFNAEQMSNVPTYEKKEPTWKPIETAESILRNSGAIVRHAVQDRAFYRPTSDSIHLPTREQFKGDAEYYGTALHELGHWTGHSSRLDRDLSGGFGTGEYAREELRAELTSYFIANETGIPHDHTQHASYVSDWVKALKDDKNEIFRAAADAGRATDFIMEFSKELTKTKEAVLKRENIQLNPNLNAEQKAVEERAIASAINNTEQHIAKYLSFPESHGGRFINSDLFKLTFDDYSKETLAVNNSAIHNSAATLANELYNRMVAKEGINTVEFLTGIPGAGKSTSVDMSKNQVMVFEGNIGNLKPTMAKIDKALSNGCSVNIIAVDTPSEKALLNTFKRFEEMGRGASTHIMAKIKSELPIALSKINEYYGDKVSLTVQDRTDFNKRVELKGWQHLNTLSKEGNYGAIRTKLDELTDQFRKDGRISEQCYNQARGNPTRELPSSDGRENGQSSQRSRVFGESKSPLLKHGESPFSKYTVAPADIYIKVHQQDYNLRDAVQGMGAKYAPDLKSWYIPKGLETAPFIPIANILLPENRLITTTPTIISAQLTKAQGNSIKAYWSKEANNNAGAWVLPANRELNSIPISYFNKSEEKAVIVTKTFEEFAREQGVLIPGTGIADGKVHRVPVDKPNASKNRDGAYCLHDDSQGRGGWVENFYSGEKAKFSEGKTAEYVPKEEQEELNRVIKERKESRLKEVNNKAQSIGYLCKDVFKPAANTHPYLEKKGIKPYDALVNKDNELVLPIRNVGGEIRGMQIIDASGSKKLINELSGNFFLIGDLTNKPRVIICEGYATGVSIHEATKLPVACAMSANNLEHVAVKIKEKYNPQIIIAADNDHTRADKNAGIEKGTQAAQAVGGKLVVPQFNAQEQAKGLTDFNDLMSSRGKMAVIKQLDKAINEQAVAKAAENTKDKGREKEM